ncbi:MAG: hypothetical protein ACSHX9_12185 [Luteolibacter sp.]
MKTRTPNRMFVKHAEEYIKRPEYYDLSATTFITEPAAEELARYRGELDLSGFSEFPASIVEILSMGKSTKLIMGGVTRLDVMNASAWKRFSGELDFPNVGAVDEETARELSECDARVIKLYGLRDLKPSVLKALASNFSILIPDDLRCLVPEIIDLETARRFLDDPESIDLSFAETLSDDSAELLCRFEGKLDFRGLVELSDRACILLSEHEGSMILNLKKTEISAQGAHELSKHDPQIDDHIILLNIVSSEKITPECACRIREDFNKGLYRDRDDRGLPILKHQSPILSEGRHSGRVINGIPIEFGCSKLSTNYAKEISDEASEILASIGFESMYLNSLESLSDRSALYLSMFKGSSLHLCKLACLSAEAAEYLTSFEGDIIISEKGTNDSEGLRILSEFVESRKLEKARLEEIERLEKERLREAERLERLRLDKIEQIRRSEEKFERDYQSAVQFLDHCHNRLPRLNHKKVPMLIHKINVFESCSEKDDEKNSFRSEVIKIATDILDSLISRDDHYRYIREKRIEACPSDFTVQIYSKRYHRVAHCFRCKNELVSSISNECMSCRWIRCICGACGCNY